MTYYCGILTSCREAALNYFALLVFGSPQAPVTGAAGTEGSGKVLPVAWPGDCSSGYRSVCADVFGECVTAHRVMFSSYTHPPHLHANLIFHSGR